MHLKQMHGGSIFWQLPSRGYEKCNDECYACMIAQNKSMLLRLIDTLWSTQSRNRREYRYRIKKSDTDTDSISIGIGWGIFWVPVSVPVSIGSFSESRYQSRYRLRGFLSFGGKFIQNLTDFHGKWKTLCSKSIGISLGIDWGPGISISIGINWGLF